MSRFIVFFCALLCAVWLKPAHLSAAGITYTQVRFSDRTEEVTLIADESLKVRRSFMLENPPRLVIDLARLGHGRGVGLSAEYSGKLLRDIRFGQYKAGTSRIVLDLTTSATYEVLHRGEQLVITLRYQPGSIPPVTQSLVPPVQKQVDAPIPQSKPMLEAKEAQKPVIVIDAGHGGKDTGALGKVGSIEKDITLAYARALRSALLRTGDYKVVLTRDSDRYLFLSQRVEIARKHGGDVFISIHADSNPNSDARGLSIYTISENASDDLAAALAKQENKADVIGGMDLSAANDVVAGILIDLAQRETRNKSSELAEIILASMEPKIPLLGNTHRFAGFRVLKAPDIPSILIEVGFLSNHSDERLVNTREYREKVVRSIVKGINSYFRQQNDS